MQCWGSDSEGQLGNGGLNTNSATPIAVSGITGADASTSATAIATGGRHTCALLANGTVQCWGDDFNGQLGDGTIGSPNSGATPSVVVGISNAVVITAGFQHTCAVLANGTVQCWGDDAYGQLGNDTPLTDSATPITIIDLNQVTAITAGDRHTCALQANGTVQCWGEDEYGQLGNDTTFNTDSPSPVVVSGLTNATAIAAGFYHTCALLSNGTVQCWGSDSFGQLGNGSPNTNSPTPVAVSGLTNATAIATGSYHTCALLASGRAQCWGYGVYGQLGNGNYSDSPTAVATNLVQPFGVTAIAAGNEHTCALLAYGTVQCWGEDSDGQLGNDATFDTDSPTPVAVSGLTGADAIAAGLAHTCALLANGTVQCWGDDAYGQLGNNASLTDSPTPVAVSGITGADASTSATAIAAGYYHTCALLANGTVQCWGEDSDGQLGNGLPLTDSPTPVAVSFLENVTAIAAGSSHTCVLLADGQAGCWGNDSDGQLGDDTNFIDSPTPVNVTGLGSPTAIAAGFAHTCAVLVNGTVRCWGNDSDGQLGNDTPLTDSPIPVVVSNLTTATAIAAGTIHTCARLADSTVQCWGANLFGQLGNNASIDDSPVPIAAAGITGADASSSATALAAGVFHTCALLANGQVSCWGRGTSGQLGNGELNTTATHSIVAFVRVFLPLLRR